jgi:hypothetical protein
MKWCAQLVAITCLCDDPMISAGVLFVPNTEG